MSDPSAPPKSIVAAFDFDGTLTFRDTLFPFLNFAVGKRRILFALPKQLPRFIGFLLGFVSRQKVKEGLLRSAIKGMSILEIRQKGLAFAEGPLQALINPVGMQRVNLHQSQGHRCILVSATLNVYLQPWCAKEKFDDLICSKLEVDENGKITGNLDGKNCWGAVKADRLIEILGKDSNFSLYAYGDARGDREMLHLSDHSFYRTFSSESDDKSFMKA